MSWRDVWRERLKKNEFSPRKRNAKSDKPKVDKDVRSNKGEPFSKNDDAKDPDSADILLRQYDHIHESDGLQDTKHYVVPLTDWIKKFRKELVDRY